MTAVKILAIVLIVAGIAGLAYGTIAYTKATHEAKVGPFDFSVKEKRTFHVPTWAGIAAIAVGIGLLVIPKRG
jgi:hypothetical protein